MSGSFIEDDLAALVNPDDFAVVGEIVSVSNQRRTVNGIFDDEDIEVEQGRVPAMVHSARFTLPTCDAPSPDDRIHIKHPRTKKMIEYRVAVEQDDGTGVTTLHLEAIRDPRV